MTENEIKKAEKITKSLLLINIAFGYSVFDDERIRLVIRMLLQKNMTLRSVDIENWLWSRKSPPTFHDILDMAVECHIE